LPLVPTISGHYCAAGLPDIAKELASRGRFHPGIYRWWSLPLCPQWGVTPLDRLHAQAIIVLVQELNQ
ncbi:hypothetical protein OEZ83_26835, partial [Leclercia adecarboxylata]